MRGTASAFLANDLSSEAPAGATINFSFGATSAADQRNPCALGLTRRYDFKVVPRWSGEVDDTDRLAPRPSVPAEGGTTRRVDVYAKQVPAPANGSLATAGQTSALSQTVLVVATVRRHVRTSLDGTSASSRSSS
ncbi:hypothetical protein ACFU99_31020 [Streptomyces sp. NPDC057654]|uniref:hypothetical protein n=1 Tax=Streptomyces sp. NPDC057654 TaxID=3346196 RepID=UPI003686995E